MRWRLGLIGEGADEEVGEKVTSFLGVGGAGAHGAGFEELCGVLAAALVNGLLAGVFVVAVAGDVVDLVIYD